MFSLVFLNVKISVFLHSEKNLCTYRLPFVLHKRYWKHFIKLLDICKFSIPLPFLFILFFIFVVSLSLIGASWFFICPIYLIDYVSLFICMSTFSFATHWVSNFSYICFILEGLVVTFQVSLVNLDNFGSSNIFL